MASLGELYAPPAGATPAPFIQAGVARQSAEAETEAGLGTSRLLRNFSERGLPALASQEAAAGRFHSGGAKQRAAWMAQDVGDQTGDIQRRLATTLADLTQGGVLAQLGVRV